MNFRSSASAFELPWLGFGLVALKLLIESLLSLTRASHWCSTWCTALNTAVFKWTMLLVDSIVHELYHLQFLEQTLPKIFLVIAAVLVRATAYFTNIIVVNKCLDLIACSDADLAFENVVEKLFHDLTKKNNIFRNNCLVTTTMGVSYEQPKYPVRVPRIHSTVFTLYKVQSKVYCWFPLIEYLFPALLLFFHHKYLGVKALLSRTELARRCLQVIDEDPAFNRVVGNFRGEDYQKFALTTLISLPFGYYAGKHIAFRHLRQSDFAQYAELIRNIEIANDEVAIDGNGRDDWASWRLLHCLSGKNCFCLVFHTI